MLKDIEDGKINLVITKDLSRLGRDYIQTGYYTEVYFQQKHVRYIAVNDGIDINREDNEIAPFKNILNDMYAKDLSRKVKVAKRQRAYKGLFISAQTPYSYKIDPMDKNHLIVDEEVSDVVKEIFRLALSGKSLVQISRTQPRRDFTILIVGIMILRMVGLLMLTDIFPPGKVYLVTICSLTVETIRFPEGIQVDMHGKQYLILSH